MFIYFLASSKIRIFVTLLSNMIEDTLENEDSENTYNIKTVCHFDDCGSNFAIISFRI